MTKILPILIVICGLCGLAGRAFGQFGPGGGMRPMGGPGAAGMGQGQPPPDKPEGPAEEAPEKQGTDVATEAVPEWPGQKQRESRLFQINGYLRGRGYYFSNLNLGHFNDPSQRANPFTLPYSELPVPVDTSNMLPNAVACEPRTGDKGCRGNSFRTADMRLRLEPMILITDNVRVMAQVDLFDNLVLGSTPEGFYINGHGGTSDAYPSIYARGQQPPHSGVNSLTSSISAKRAWGEIHLPFFDADLSFGRMPFMWGTGMLFHDGNASYDPRFRRVHLRSTGQLFHGDCNDCDFGTTVDRLMIVARFWNHFVQLSWDWAASGPTSQILYNQQLLGWNYNADNVDDVNQWTFAVGRKDDEADIQERLLHKQPVFNYAAFLMLRTQDWDLRYNPRPQPTPQNQAQETGNYYSATEVLRSLGRRGAWTLTPDLWARLDVGDLHLEAEGAAVFGNIMELDGPVTVAGATPPKASVTVRQFGGLIRGHYRLLRDKSLKLAAEIGSASGPQNGDPTAELNWRRAQDAFVGPLSNGQTSLTHSRFVFDPDYHVDMIMFRRILGTVYNATYIKPSVSYWLIDSFGGQVDLIYSLANKPATFPGHAVNMGMEINARLMYKNEDEGFYITAEYGVLFSLGALEQTASIWDQTPGTFVPLPAVGGTTAQVFQAKLMLKF